MMVESLEPILVGAAAVVSVGIMYMLVLWPTAVILRRAGYSRLWTLAWFVPLLNLIGIWMFCFRRWPIDRLRDAHKGSDLPPLPKSL